MKTQRTNIIKVDSTKPRLDLLARAADIIQRDGVIGYPTETVYGLGGNALSANAIEKVYQLKNREKTKPVLIIARHIEQVKSLVVSFSNTAMKLANRFWPGALTMVLEASPQLPKLLLGGSDRVGIRVPDNRICLELIKLCGVPITSSSANISGQKNPISAVEVFENFRDKVDLIIDGGPSVSRTPSTIISVQNDTIYLIREGAIPKSEIEQAIGKLTDEKKER